MKLLIFLIFYLVSLTGVSSRKCVVVINSGEEYIECKDVTTLNEILNEWDHSWSSLHIINRPGTRLLITDVPQDSIAVSLRELDLSKANQLHISDAGFKDFKHLHILNLSNAQLDTVCGTWFPNNLRRLNLSGNRLSEIEGSFFHQLVRTTELSLASNEISSLKPDVFNRMRSLSTLDLSRNDFQSVQDVGRIVNLKSLRLSDNLISEVRKDDFKDLVNLTMLDLSYNTISRLGEDSFKYLDLIQTINLAGNILEKIPSRLFSLNLNHLENLNLSDAKIKNLEPNCFETLINLKTLDLSGNILDDLNESLFSGLSTLKLLNLSNNQILNMQPRTFQSMTSLEILDLSKNRLQTIDENGFGSSGSHLKQLDLSRNQLLFLQPHLFEPIRNVRIVDVSHNQLKNFDENLFVPLTKINKLSLSYNLIEDIPVKAYEMLRTLTEVRIDNNKLTFLRTPSVAVRRLRTIILHNNPWQCYCLDEIINYFPNRNIIDMRGLQTDGSKPICVQAEFFECVKNIQQVRQEKIVQLFESPEAF